MIVQQATHLAFRAVRKASRLGRWVPGERSVQLFGRRLRFTSDSIIRTPTAVLYPRRGWDNTVAYADFVQTHAVTKHMEETGEPPMVMDIGAFHGFYAVLLGNIARERGGRMVAVEPSGDSYDVLCRNVRLNQLNDHVACVRAAVGEQPGTVAFDGDRAQARVGQQAEDDGPASSGTGASGTGGSVPMVTVGQLAAEHGMSRIDVLVIDVEGFELPVLRGLPADLPTGMLFCELHPYLWKDYGYQWQDLLDWLDQRDLVCLDAYLRPIDRPMGDAYLGPTLMMPRERWMRRLGAAAGPSLQSALDSSVAGGTGHGTL